jgi:putative sigma-54 modulation protein
MEYLIRGDKVKVTSSIKKYVEDKLARLDKYFEEPDNIKVTALIRVKDNEEIIEVTIPTHKFTLRAEEKHKDLYAAIDLVTDKLERQIRKNKTRLHDRVKKDAHPDFIFNFDEPEENEDKIVKRKSIEIKPMNEEEAILKMELLDHDFYVFNNEDADCISVLYKRKDGNYGIINTK